MDWRERIVVNPKVLVGKPTIKGTRLAVEFILELLAERWSHEQILKSYPQLSADDIWAVLHYAAEMLKQERVLGQFTSAIDPAKRQAMEPDISEEELERRFRQGGGRALKDILEDLEKQA
jgi:uncharacterized protein (DUF433 family)